MNEKINLQDLSALLAERAAITKKEAEIFLREYFEVMNEELVKSGLLKIKDLGVFKLSLMENRESINVTTGERVLIPAHYKVVFTPDKKLAETVNEPFAFFETTEIEDSALGDLKLLPEEDALEESESAPEEDEEIVFAKASIPEEKIVSEKEPALEEKVESVLDEEPSLEEKQELISEEKQKPVSEERLTSEEDLSSVSDWRLKNFCSNCHDLKAHHIFRKKYYESRRKLRWLRAVVCILFILFMAALGYIAYLLQFDKYLPFKKSSYITEVTESVSAISTQDTVPAISVDTVALAEKKVDNKIPESKIPESKATENKVTENKAAENKIPENKVTEKKIPEKKISENKILPETSGKSKQITILAGQRLTSIALKEYGNKVFWIYIYLENKAVISNPDVLPVGAKITIPPAGKYGIDSNNPASVQKAKDLTARNY